MTLLRSLGMETDMDIVKSVSDNPEIIKIHAGEPGRGRGLNQRGGPGEDRTRVAAGQAKEYQKKRAAYVLDRYLLPHIGVEEKHRLSKACSSPEWLRPALSWRLAAVARTIKDHYSNKRLKLSGDLMEDLFRVAFNRLTRDIKCISWRGPA